ncbi:MAG: hypothetical protein ACRESC_06625, partial [Gammaproteobacteria bacterium]
MTNGNELTAPGFAARRMKLRLLRWNLHHIALVCVVLASIAMLEFGWAAFGFGILALLLVVVSADGMVRPGSSLF